ncbi:MAG: helix-turn-helix transcriptional regulator [Phycisphaerales bacterium]|nr:helix-turn-helix transcriptional regulator [Phycisphaerales bacterium]
MSRILDEIRKQIERSAESRYAISKATGIDQAQLSRVMNGRGGMSIDVLERLANHLGLEVVIRPKRKRKRR